MYTKEQVIKLSEDRANFTKKQNETALTNEKARELIGKTYNEPESDKVFEVQDYIWDDFHNLFFYILLETVSKRTYHISEGYVQGYLENGQWKLKTA